MRAALVAPRSHEAAAGGAAMLFTPEMSGLLDRDRARAMRHLHLQVRRSGAGGGARGGGGGGIWVHLGSLALLAPRRRQAASTAAS